MIQRREQQRDVAGPVRDASRGEGDEEGFEAGGGGGEGREGREHVVGGGGADCDFGAGGADADAGDDDVGGAVVEGEGGFAVGGVADVALRDGEVGFESGGGDAFFEEEGGEFGGGADDCGAGSQLVVVGW